MKKNKKFTVSTLELIMIAGVVVFIASITGVINNMFINWTNCCIGVTFAFISIYVVAICYKKLKKFGWHRIPVKDSPMEW